MAGNSGRLRRSAGLIAMRKERCRDGYVSRQGRIDNDRLGRDKGNRRGGEQRPGGRIAHRKAGRTNQLALAVIAIVLVVMSCGVLAHRHVVEDFRNRI